MAKRKPNPIKPASLSNPNPDYVFPIPEANKILGNAYIYDGNATAERVESDSHNKRNVDEMRSDKEQLGFAADDIRVGKEYLSGKRHAFNVQRKLDIEREDGYMPDLYQPMMNLDQEPHRIDTYDWRHYRDDGPEWVGNFVASQIEDLERTNRQIETPLQHIQIKQFKTSTKARKPHNDDQLRLF